MPALHFQSGRCRNRCRHPGMTVPAPVGRDCTPWARGKEEKAALDKGTPGAAWERPLRCPSLGLRVETSTFTCPAPAPAPAELAAAGG